MNIRTFKPPLICEARIKKETEFANLFLLVDIDGQIWGIVNLFSSEVPIAVKAQDLKVRQKNWVDPEVCGTHWIVPKLCRHCLNHLNTGQFFGLAFNVDLEKEERDDSGKKKVYALVQWADETSISFVDSQSILVDESKMVDLNSCGFFDD